MKDFDEIKAELEAIKAKKGAKKSQRNYREWYGLVYCDSNGWASIIGDNLEGVWLGRTDEVIPYLKSRHIDGENVYMVLQAVRQLHSKEAPKHYERPRFFGMDGYVPLPSYGQPSVGNFYSCHLATNSDTPCVFTPPSKSIVATFKKDPCFLDLLERLISQGMGIRAIHSELRTKGYQVPMRTLGRWVKKRRDAI